VQLRVNKRDDPPGDSKGEYISMPLDEILTGVEEVVSKKMQSKIQYLKERIETVR
jgi:hypothetical protein